jgi:hypothetical protein
MHPPKDKPYRLAVYDDKLYPTKIEKKVDIIRNKN